MKTLNGLSATSFQKFQVQIEGDNAEFLLKYNPATRTWLIDIFYGDVSIYNTRICHNLNLLSQYSDIIPFGLYVSINGIVEPVLIDDFSIGRAELNILTSEEADSIERGYTVLR